MIIYNVEKKFPNLDKPADVIYTGMEKYWLPKDSLVLFSYVSTIYEKDHRDLLCHIVCI